MQKHLFLKYLILINAIAITVFNQRARVFAQINLDIDKQNIINIIGKSNFTTLYDSDKESIYLIIQNVSGKPIILRDICILSGSNIRLECKKNNLAGLELKPHEEILVTYDVITDRYVSPGKDSIFFDCKFSYDKNTYFNKIYVMDVNLSVSASNEIFLLIGVPSFFLLPGMLFMIIASYFLKKRNLWSGIEFKTPFFWMLSITISLVISYIYPILSEAVGRHNRNLFRTYGLEDIIIIWSGSIFLGIIFTCIFIYCTRVKNNRYTFSEKDSPLTVILKAYRIKHRLLLDMVNIKYYDDEKQFCLLQQKDETYWVCPQIKIYFKKGIITKLENENKNEKMKNIIQEIDKPEKIIKYLKKNRRNLIFQWDDPDIKRIEIIQNAEIYGKQSLVVYT